MRPHLSSVAHLPATVRAVPPRLRWVVAWAAVGLLVLSLAALGWQGSRGERPVESFAELLEGGRPIAARLSFADADRYWPLQARRGRPRLERLLGRLDGQGQQAGVVAAYLLGGSLQQARAQARRMPPSAQVRSDLAAIELESGHPAEALALTEESLEGAPAVPRTLWNEALAREKLGFPLAAAAAFDEVAVAGERGWAHEASERAAALRAGQAVRLTRAHRIDEAAAALQARFSVPDPALVARNPELWREQFYEALRKASGAPRLDALAPLAATLDRIFGGALLQGHIERVRQNGIAGEPAALALTAPVFSRARPEAERSQLVAAVDYAKGTGDDWLEIRAEGVLAIQEAVAGDAPGALARLAALIERCRAAGFRRLAEEQRLRRSWVLDFRHTFPEAVASSETALANVRALDDLPLERVALIRLAYHTAGRLDPGRVRAYFAELLGMTPASCEVQGLMAVLLANIALKRHDLPGVSREIKAGARCPEDLGASGANALRELVAAGGTHEEHELLVQTLAALRRRRGLPPSRELTLEALEARLLAPTPAETLTRLQRLRGASLALPDDDWSGSARTLINLPLVIDAVARGDHRLAFGLFLDLQRGHGPADQGCLLGLAVDGGTAVALVRDGSTALGDLMPADELRRRGHQAFSVAIRRALERCPEIAVVTPGELYGRPGLLPTRWAWAYGGDPDPIARGSTRVRLVVAGARTPPELDLEPLSAWTALPRRGTQTIYRGGLEATPEEVLRRAPEADEIDFHVHGVFDRAISTVPYLALAPDRDGRYALTADAVRKMSLRAHAPVVLLAACQAARSGENTRTPWSLARAMLEAGASAVIAAPSEIPDADAGVFFEEVSQALDRTPSPAIAVQQVRQRHAAPVGHPNWLDEVVVFVADWPNTPRRTP
jgi:hypothetical protein